MAGMAQQLARVFSINSAPNYPQKHLNIALFYSLWCCMKSRTGNCSLWHSGELFQSRIFTLFNARLGWIIMLLSVRSRAGIWAVSLQRFSGVSHEPSHGYFNYRKSSSLLWIFQCEMIRFNHRQPKVLSVLRIQGPLWWCWVGFCQGRLCLAAALHRLYLEALIRRCEISQSAVNHIKWTHCFSLGLGVFLGGVMVRRTLQIILKKSV